MAGGCIVVGKGTIKNHSRVDLSLKREEKKPRQQLHVLPHFPRNAVNPDQKYFWLGDRMPNDSERDRLQMFYRWHNLVWPREHSLRWFTPSQLLKHLRRVAGDGGDQHTYLLIHESGLKRYVEPIYERLTAEKLWCNFFALDEGGKLVAVYNQSVSDRGESQWSQRWALPVTRGELKTGHWRRPIVMQTFF